MANKKISQLAGTLPKEIVSGSYLFPSAAGNAGIGYETKKITALEIAEYAFTGEGGGFPATQLSGTKNVYLNNSNWINSTATQPPNYGFLMLRTTDGLLTTGSGIGTPVDGDNLGNHTATEALNMQGNDITSADDINFQSSTSRISRYNANNQNLLVKAHSELTLQANKHVFISGDALSLATIPISGALTISGDVTVTGANLEIDPAHKLIVNEITTYGTQLNDPGALFISGAAAFHVQSGVDEEFLWNTSNIQYAINTDAGDPAYAFSNVRNGQTLTVYVQNTHSAPITPTFSLAGEATLDYPSPVEILWGGEFDESPPVLAEKKTNVYTFVNIKTGIFASAVTGYVY